MGITQCPCEPWPLMEGDKLDSAIRGRASQESSSNWRIFDFTGITKAQDQVDGSLQNVR